MSYIDDLDVSVSSDPRAEEDKQRAFDEENEKKDKIKKLLPIIIPCALVVALLVATVPSYLGMKSKYNYASSLISAGKFDEAKEAFIALGDYSDAKDQAEYNVEYYRALNIVSEGDDLIENQGEKAVEKYEEAISALEALSGYKDSEEVIAEIEKKINAYDEKVHEADYQSAIALLEEGKYSSAKEAFDSLKGYKDSEDQSKNCIYTRAMKLMDYINSNEVRGVYASPTYDEEDFEIEQTNYPVLDMRPICDVAEEEFMSISGYKDSDELAAVCADKGDFTKEFFNLCKEGNLAQAQEWLDTYSDEFEERETYSDLISSCLRYCSNWALYKGDSSLLPTSGGYSEKCSDIVSKIKIEDGICTLVINGANNEFEVVMELNETMTGYIKSVDDGSNYFAVINNQNHLTYTQYNSSGKSVSACEYKISEAEEEK